MASQGNDLVTGSPTFLEDYEMQQGADLTEVAAYAAKRGTRLVGTAAARTSFGYKTEGLLWRDTTDGITYEVYDGEWEPIESPWIDYTPTWVGTIGNGTLIAKYCHAGYKKVKVRITLVWGSTTSGGAGNWSFGLPAGITASEDGEQIMVCKAFTTSSLNWSGTAIISAGGTAVTPFLPVNAESGNVAEVRNADGTGTIGTGRPLISGQYTFSVAGHNLVIYGEIETE
jgi:hypothetical protein